jgi:hypothetical protein
VAHEAAAEEGAHAAARAVDDLVGDDHVQRLDLLTHRAHRAGAQEPAHAQALEGVDVGAHGDLRGQQTVATTMPWQEGDARAP